MENDLITELKEIVTKLESIDSRISEIDKAEPKKPCTDIPVAVVEIIGGLAHVVRKDAGFLLRIIDRDSVDTGTPLDEAMDTYYMEDVIEDKTPEEPAP